ncbi:hypothetical protein [Methylobacterium sp. WL116]|uniref:hypothetical protein n=1 Tax=Methylobacterium sp. WL116 TaxID=2603889 RepID=UPI00164F83AF|nr:hypothetical protein [Methylobacterium sp. WL116]
MAGMNASRKVDPIAVVERWHLTLGTLADNDNERRGVRTTTLAAVLSLPIASTAVVAACLRFLS